MSYNTTPSSPDLSAFGESGSEASTPPTSPEPMTPEFCHSPLATYTSTCSDSAPWRLDCRCKSGGGSMPPIPNLESYMAFKRDAFHDAYECGPACRQCVAGVAQYVTTYPTDSVMATAATDAESILELAARCATGCGAPFAPESAVLFADIVLKRHGAHERVEQLVVSDTDHSRAHAIASLAYLIKYRAKATAGTLAAYLEDADLLHAAMDADMAVCNGYRFAGAFEVAAAVLELGTAHGQDVRGGPRFGEFTHLWRAHDVRQRVLEKMRHAPAKYTCAAPSCAFRSLKARQFRRCAGPCASEVKPSYCSKECQREDWERHKAVCESRAKSQHELSTAKTHIPTSNI